MLIIEEDLAFSVSELALRCGVGRTKIYEEIKAGRLIARKLGSRTLIALSDVEKWLKALPQSHLCKIA